MVLSKVQKRFLVFNYFRLEDRGECFWYRNHKFDTRTYFALEKKGLVTLGKSEEPFGTTGVHPTIYVLTDEGKALAQKLIEEEGWKRR